MNAEHLALTERWIANIKVVNECGSFCLCHEESDLPLRDAVQTSPPRGPSTALSVAGSHPRGGEPTSPVGAAEGPAPTGDPGGDWELEQEVLWERTRDAADRGD